MSNVHDLLAYETYLNPQSSHSSTGFHPNLLAQISHLLPSNVLLKRKSSGFHVAVSGGVIVKFRAGEVVPLLGSLPVLPMLMRRPPGLMSVNLWTSGMPMLDRWGIVEPPSVAAAMEISDRAVRAVAKDEMEPAVWNESIVMRESVGVGPCTPIASGRVSRSSEPLGV